MIRRICIAALVLGLPVLALGVPLAYRAMSSEVYRNARVVEPGRLYRSGQMSPEGFARFVREHGIRTVVSLRDSTDESTGAFEDQFEEDYCREHGLTFHRIGPTTQWLPPEEMRFPFHGQVHEFRRFLRQPTTQWPVLVHCFAGIHRTGASCAVYRMEFQGWSSDDAIEEMWAMGNSRSTFDDDLLTYMQEYRPLQDRSRSAPPMTIPVSTPVSTSHAAKFRVIAADAATGSAAAVVVESVPLVHTAQLFPTESGPMPAQVESLLTRLDKTLQQAASQLEKAVKINIYVAEQTTVAVVQAALAKRFSGPHAPAVSYVQTALPGGAAVAADAVAVTPRVSRGPDYAVLPAGSRVYVSGQLEKGKTLAASTQATLASLRRSLAEIQLGDEQVVQVKAFLHPMEQAEAVRQAYAEFFGKTPAPPLVLVEWGSANSIEIELIAASPAPRGPNADTLEFLTPKGMTASPVYCRMCRVHAPETVYIAGLHSRKPGDGSTQVTDIFEQLRGILEQTGSDFRHLVKATYYVSDNDSSQKLNELRPRFYDPKRPPAASKAPVTGVGRAERSLTIDMIAVPKP
ncbi:MAG: tyrosine-protein phosphatase [Bacteroidales bacterium]|nr:tyrosine-protein phosphatase [Bacteroidales bacterium]